MLFWQNGYDKPAGLHIIVNQPTATCFDFYCTLGSWGFVLYKQYTIQLPQELNEHTESNIQQVLLSNT